ncbi:Uncharacterized protein encoded in toxicity protection region of plasmid R478, contains von Willebrand factor (vWF) domain [Slackia heliotrinireducens]|jgi:uncharacterized protein YegL|uniref:VWFA domain-containing protein n=1 Tax=Slackia heliotrinireducens (strain ATCC 29202 / DSM 20476 / NCTC 11029 / RHS 1) TaxID=471855 RepID=C7N2F8_SLAHD|nr:VWA domain-containing protein [Slackia heliotrinireducens]ACV21464.1 uncharacterized protein Shel_04030 [Slackia heliotrinireducens DSM 20476]VEG98903.1 Uncharacterized protein encoded in toxicity protection region of plasmid R478, contains von Willebrand factor (vWF) domain [Slackia heliotrinireducens]
MPNIGDTQSKARKLLPIIYVLDTSGSMNVEGRISAVNEAMRETMDVLKDVAAKNPTAELKIGVLAFSSGASWVTKDPSTGAPALLDLDDFYWNDMTAGGVTDLGAAMTELDNQLNRSAMLVSDTGFKVPVLIFMSDGGPTDDWESAYNKAVANNRWVKSATKIAIAVGDGADRGVLTRVADGNDEAVIGVTDRETLKRLIKVVSVTASMINGKSRTADTNQNEIVNEINRTMGEEGKTQPEFTPEPEPEPETGGGFAEGWDDDDDTWE